MGTRICTATLRYPLELGWKVSRCYAQKQFGITTILCLWIMLAAMAGFAWYGLALPCYQIAGIVISSSIAIYFWYRYEVRRRWPGCSR